MRIKDTKANKIFMLIALSVVMILIFSSKFSKRETMEQTINYQKGVVIEALSANINIWVDKNLRDAKVVYATKDSNMLEIYVDSKGYTIMKEKQKNKFFNIAFDNERPTISLYLPSTEIGDLELKTLSGAIELFSSFDTNNFTINSMSGNVGLLDISAKETLKIKTISSNISLDIANAPLISLYSISGNIEIVNINSTDVSIASTNGSIDIDAIKTDKLKVSSTSSDVELDLIDAKNEISVSTVSGDLVLKVADKKYKYKINTTSGDILINNNAFEKQYSTTEGVPFNVKSVSGEITINSL
jgi:DUF4097 and DUF4098 domain-containing protein YvlB